MLEQEHSIVVEPFFVWYDYENKKRRYFPDLLVDGNRVIEIKPAKFILKEQNIHKWKALTEHCKEHNISCELWTEEDITLLSKDDIECLVNDRIVVLTNKGIKS